MRWQLGRRSTNIEDRRGMGVPRAGGIGCLGLLLVLVISYFTGTNPLQLLQQFGQVETDTSSPVDSAQPAGAPSDPEGEFVARILGDTEDAWIRIFAESGRQYEAPSLVLFTGAAQSACGFNTAAVGPFYCPPDRKVYLDLSFFRQLSQEFGAPGDFASAYVIAHEVGHHVQNLLGISGRIDRLRRQAGEAEANRLSVQLELQADCFAGVWGYHAKQRLLEPGDVEEGLRAAQSIGDDLLQKRAQGYANPDSFTHGTSEQRARWLRRGLEAGRVDQCEDPGI